jgi:replicative DNA helicase
LQHVPPQNLDAEESVLGAMMIAPGAIDAVTEILHVADFYRESHGRIYRAAQGLHDAGEPVDPITLTSALEQRGELEKVGGRMRLHELARLVPATANARHYAEIVHESATLRGLIRAGGEIAQLGWSREGEPAQLIDQAEQLIGELGGRDLGDGFSPIRDGLNQTCQQLIEAGNNTDGIIGVPTGFRSLDHLTAGFQPGNLVILAARPSVGKSALALKIGWHACRHSEGSVGLVSLEMSRAEIVQRLLACCGHVDLHALRTGRLGREETARVFHHSVTTALAAAPLHIDDHAATVAEIKSRLRKLKRKHGLSLAIVDYLQLVAPPGRNQNRTRNDEVAEVTRALKLLAVELDVPVLALSQLNRKLEDRAEKRPQLSDLRDSGAIEQDANLVLLMHRVDEQTTEVMIAKNRNGPTGDVKLAFVKKEATFTERAEHMPGVLG